MSKRIKWRGSCDQCGKPTSDFFGDEKAPVAEFCPSCMKKFMKMNKRVRGHKLLFLAGWRGVPARELPGDGKTYGRWMVMT